MSSDDPVEGLSEFFSFVWGDNKGFVYLPTLNRETERWRSVFFSWPEHSVSIIRHVMGSSAKGEEVYFSPALYKGNGPNDPGQPVKQNVLGTNVLWTEFDGNAPNWHESTEATGEASEGVSGPGRAPVGVPEPSLRVQSSLDGHEHVYWKLDEFVEDKKWAEEKNKSITYSNRSDTSGWDITQILRPPYTQNYKRDRPVTIVEATGNKYGKDVFSHLKAPPQIVSDIIIEEALPDVETIVAVHSWDEEHFKLFMDPEIPEGKRSAALMRLGYFCIEVGMSDTEAYAILLHADKRWKKYEGRADQKRRLIDIIDRARQKNPGAGGKDIAFQGLLGSAAKADVDRSYIYGLQDFLDSDIEVEWVIEGLLEKGGMGITSSAPGVGKTQVVLNMAFALALGEDFLCWKVPEPQKILFLSLEMGHVGLKIFLKQMAQDFPDKMERLQENFIVVPLGEDIGLDTKQGQAFVESILKEVKPDGILIDAMGKLTLGDFDGKSARALNKVYAELRNRYDLWMWFIHHNRKASGDNKRPTNLADVYGDVYVTTDMSSVLVLWPQGNDIEVHRAKARYSEQERPFLIERSENLTFKVKPEITVEDMSIAENLASQVKDENGKGRFSF